MILLDVAQAAILTREVQVTVYNVDGSQLNRASLDGLGEKYPYVRDILLKLLRNILIHLLNSAVATYAP
jgi:hypothetical protein